MTRRMRKLSVIVTILLVFYVAFHYVEYRRFQLGKTRPIDTKGQPRYSRGVIELVVFQDFRCVGCKYFQDHIFPRLKVKFFDLEKVSYVVIPLAFLLGSVKVSHLALSIHLADPAYFFPFVEKVYEHPFWNNSTSYAALLQQASTLSGINIKAVKAASRYSAAPALDRNFAQAKKVMGKVATPGIFVNGVDVSELSQKDLMRYIDTKLWELRRSGVR